MARGSYDRLGNFNQYSNTCVFGSWGSESSRKAANA